MKFTSTQVKVNTKSNYMGLNDIWLDVFELQGRRVTIKYSHPKNEIVHTIDFTLDEVLEFRSIVLQG